MMRLPFRNKRPKDGLSSKRFDAALIPTEVVMGIIQHLTFTEVSKTSRVCKTWYSILTPYIYNSIHGDPSDHSRHIPFLSVDLLLRTCIENPNLALQIKNLSFLDEEETKNTKWRTTSQVPTYRAQQAINTYLKSFGIHSHHQWIGELRKGDPEAYILLLIIQLQSIETLAFSYSPDIPNALIEQVFSTDKSRAPTSVLVNHFKGLKKLKLAYEGSSSPSVTKQYPRIFLSLFQLPALQGLNVEIPTCKPLRWPRLQDPPCSSLVSLDLPECEADETSLAMLLKATPRLQYLSYDRVINVDTSYRFPVSRHHCFWDLDALCLALWPLRKQLRELTLSFMFYANSSLEVTNPSKYWGVRGQVFDWTEFPGLEKMEIPFLTYLNGSEDPRTLPPNVREVKFGDDMGDHSGYPWTPNVVLPIVEKLLAQRSVLAPKMVHLGLVCRKLDDDGGEIERWETDDIANWLNVFEGSRVDTCVSKVTRY